MAKDDQLAARKEAWLDIEARLTAARTLKGDLKILQAYYLKGKEPKWSEEEDAMEDDPIPLVYRLWLHPDQSDASWCAITERVLGYTTGGLTGRSLRTSTSILHTWASSAMFNGKDAPSSFMQGLEKRIFQFMAGETAPGNRYTYEGEPLYGIGWFGFFYFKELAQWLEASAPSNPFQINHYALGQWRKFIEGSNLLDKFIQDCKTDSRFEENVKRYFVAIHRCPAPDDPSAATDRSEYGEQARAMMDTGFLPPLLQTWWDQARVSAA